jgi:hypothetical protein
MTSHSDDYSGIRELPDKRGEARSTAIALLIAGAVLGLFIFLALRPALVLGNDAEAIASSLAGEVDNDEWSTSDLVPLQHACAESDELDADFACLIRFVGSGDIGSGAAPRAAAYAVDINRLGCWEAIKVETGQPGLPGASGCIGMLDY